MRAAMHMERRSSYAIRDLALPSYRCAADRSISCICFACVPEPRIAMDIMEGIHIVRFATHAVSALVRPRFPALVRACW